jgi:hypothetical protein
MSTKLGSAKFKKLARGFPANPILDKSSQGSHAFPVLPEKRKRGSGASL